MWAKGGDKSSLIVAVLLFHERGSLCREAIRFNGDKEGRARTGRRTGRTGRTGRKERKMSGRRR